MQVAERIARKALRNFAELSFERSPGRFSACRRQVHEKESAPFGNAGTMQAARVGGHVFGLDEGRRDQTAIQRIGPRMVWTANRAAQHALAAEQTASAMPAEIQMRVQAILTTD